MNRARFRSFVADLTRLVERCQGDEAATLETGAELLGALVRCDDWLPQCAATPHLEHYQQFLLHCDPFERFSVVSFVWGPGQRTPVHDHTVWGLIGVLRGAELARSYALTGALLSPGPERRLEPGAVDRVSPTIGDIHEVANAYSDRASISIHLYGANIGAVHRHVYETGSGTVKSFVSGYSSPCVPNFWDRSTEARSRAL